MSRLYNLFCGFVNAEVLAGLIQCFVDYSGLGGMRGKRRVDHSDRDSGNGSQSRRYGVSVLTTFLEDALCFT